MHTKILKRCGVVLIGIGVLDIAYMVWCIAHDVSYSSSLNVFALVGGILLVRGGLRTARWVAAISTFVVATCAAAVVVMPFMYPPDYWKAVFSHDGGFVIALLIATGWTALFVWVRRQMMHPSVREAQTAARLPPPPIKFAFAAGIALPLLLAVILGLTLHGESAHEAMRRAELQLGPSFQYVVTNLNISSAMKTKSVSAVVTAYNDAELKTIRVAWTE